MKIGIDTSPKNFNVFRSEIKIKLLSVWNEPFASVSTIDGYLSGIENITRWLVKPSISLESSLSEAIGSKIKIKIKINRENFR